MHMTTNVEKSLFIDIPGNTINTNLALNFLCISENGLFLKYY